MGQENQGNAAGFLQPPDQQEYERLKSKTVGGLTTFGTPDFSCFLDPKFQFPKEHPSKE